MDIITGYLGEPHITADQDRDINIGIVGDGSYVMPTGQRLAAEVSSNNEVRIRDGVIMHQGCAASIKKNTYDPVTIINGSQGMKRIDLIVARYERNVETGVETISLVALQGTPTEGSPETPEYTEGDIQSGDTVADMPLYKVQIDGLNITGLEKVFEEIESLRALNSKIQSRTPQIISGTKVINNINNVTAVVLFTLSELQSAFKAPDAKRDCFACAITNGDELASSNHFDGTTWKGEELMALFSDKEVGAARINYIVAYNPNAENAI